MAKTKKSLGQHFLTNPATADRIVGSISREARTILEVGPGPGILTERLARLDAKLICVEKDDHLSIRISEEYAGEGVIVVNEDFLKVDLRQLTSDPNTSLVGNFPYNISSQIVFRMLENKDLFAEMVGMFQLEMARRIVAPPGNKEYGVISVLTQSYYDGELLFQVKPGQFNPPPKVMSAVIRLERKADLDLPCSEKWLRTVVKRAFGQRRKMIRNTLKGLIPLESLDAELLQQRPEQLPLETFYSLAVAAENHARSQQDDENFTP